VDESAQKFFCFFATARTSFTAKNSLTLFSSKGNCGLCGLQPVEDVILVFFTFAFASKTRVFALDILFQNKRISRNTRRAGILYSLYNACTLFLEGKRVLERASESCARTLDILSKPF